MKISIHQPSYWPWLGLLHKIHLSDAYVILDNVNISKGSFQYRNQFLCNGNIKYITLPIAYDSKMKLSEVKFKRDEWRENQLSFIRNYYLHSEYFDEIFPHIDNIYNEYYSNDACSFIIQTMFKTLEFFDIKTEVYRASNQNFIDKRGQLVLEICKFYGAKKYISGQGAKSYMDEDLINSFSKNNIDIEWQKFNFPEYSQFNSKDKFISGLSSLDLLFNHGITSSRRIFNQI